MAKHAANTTEAVPRLKPLKARGLIFHPFDELDRALDDDFEQMSKRYTQKNTEVSTSIVSTKDVSGEDEGERALPAKTEEPCLKQ